MAPSKSVKPTSSSRKKPTSGSSRAESGIGTSRPSGKAPAARSSAFPKPTAGPSTGLGARHTYGMGQASPGPRRSSVSTHAPLRRSSIGSPYFAPARSSTSLKRQSWGKSGALGGGYLAYKSKFGIGRSGFDEDEDEEDEGGLFSDEGDGGSLTALFDDNNAIDELSDAVEEEIDDEFETDVEHSVTVTAHSKLKQHRQAARAQLDALAQSGLVNGPEREVEALQEAYSNAISASDELFNGVLGGTVSQAMIEAARKIESHRKSATDTFIKQYKELRKTIELNQKQAVDSLEAAKDLLAQLAEEREAAERDIQTARKRMESNLKKARAELETHSKTVLQQLNANAGKQQAQRKGRR